MVFAYLSMESFDYYSLKLASLATLISTFAASIGEAAIIGYLKGIPQELIMMYGIGKSSTRCTSIVAFVVLLRFGPTTIKWFFPVVLILGPYIMCFEWIDEKRLTHNQIYNVYKIKSVQDAP